MSNYKIEFPEYDDTLNIPDGWVDISWHNNACPSISKTVNKEWSVDIWCDYMNPDRREMGVGCRFVVSTNFNDEDYEQLGEFHTLEHAILFANVIYKDMREQA